MRASWIATRRCSTRPTRTFWPGSSGAARRRPGTITTSSTCCATSSSRGPDPTCAKPRSFCFRGLSVAKSAVHAEIPAPLEAQPTQHLIASAIEGRDALFLAELASSAGQLLHVARDGPRANHLADLVRFFAPELELVALPAWDCLPYDRVSPNQDIMAERLDALARLLDERRRGQPPRLDLFGDVLEAIRGFDPLTQRSLGKVARFELRPVSEVLLDEAAIARFRVGYLQHFGAATGDPLFESICAGRPFPGMEHWLPLFHERLVGIDAWLDPACAISCDPQADDAIAARLDLIGDHYEARKNPPEAARAMGATPYRPLPPDELYLSERQVASLFEQRARYDLSTFAAAPDVGIDVVDLEARPARNFAAERARPDVNLFDDVAQYVDAERAAGRRILIAAASEGSLERLRMVLADHGVAPLRRLDAWSEVDEGSETALAVLPLDHGFVTATHCVLAEPDIFGDRLARPARRRRRAD